MEALEAAGQPAQYWEYHDKSHAFLDSGSNRLLRTGFALDAPPALNVMIRFLDDIFIPNRLDVDHHFYPKKVSNDAKSRCRA